jgi:capsular exopolysaccharide synthesis family protein
LVTSSNPLEGKSLISSNLSIIMAQMGYKTVLVDTDMRRSSVHKILGIANKDKGVTDILSGKITLDQAMRNGADLLLEDLGQDEALKNPWMENFFVLTAGATFPNTPYLLNTEKMDQLLNDLRQSYDVVVIDSSPVLAVSDPSILVPKMDGVILVYRAGATSRISLRRAKAQVESVKDKKIIKGIVLNNVTPDVAPDTYYYYYHKGGYYTESP